MEITNKLIFWLIIYFLLTIIIIYHFYLTQKIENWADRGTLSELEEEDLFDDEYVLDTEKFLYNNPRIKILLDKYWEKYHMGNRKLVAIKSFKWYWNKLFSQQLNDSGKLDCKDKTKTMVKRIEIILENMPPPKKLVRMYTQQCRKKLNPVKNINNSIETNTSKISNTLQKQGSNQNIPNKCVPQNNLSIEADNQFIEKKGKCSSLFNNSFREQGWVYLPEEIKKSFNLAKKRERSMKQMNKQGQFNSLGTHSFSGFGSGFLKFRQTKGFCDK